MEKLDIIQDKIYDSGSVPTFSIAITYRMYAIDNDNDNNWHYANKTNTITIDDYMELAMVKAQGADMDLLETAVVLEYAIAKIAEETTNLGNTTLT